MTELPVPTRHPFVWLSTAAVVVVIAVGTFTNADPDLWGHLRFGLDALRTHTLPSVDPYSFTQDVPWTNHEWLSEVQMALAYRILGSAGLGVLKGLLAASAVLLIWRALRDVRFDARLCLAAAAALGLLSLGRTLRPQLWSVVAVAVLCSVLVSRHQRHRWWLPVLFAVWANLHGGWILGLGIVGVWTLGEWPLTSARLARGVALLGACALATLINPYGFGLWRFLVMTVHLERHGIEEWMPIWRFGPSVWLVPLAWAVLSLWTLWRAPSQRFARAATLALVAILGIRVVRVAPFFVEAAAILLAPVLALRWPAKPVAVRTPADRLVIAVLPIGLTAIAAWVLSISLRCVSVDAATQPDPTAVAALSESNGGRLVTFFDWGEYALWHWGPRLRVSIDGRRETVHSDLVVAQNEAIVSGQPDGLEVLTRWRPDYVWLPAASGRTKAWLSAHGYRIEVDTARSFVAVRSDLEPLRGGVLTPMGCFPG